MTKQIKRANPAHTITGEQMTTLTYVQNPHLAIQRALAQAHREGATKATITLNHTSKLATLQDNRNGDEPHTQTFNINTHPADGHYFQITNDIRDHPTPEGMEATLVSKYYDGKEYSEKLHSIDHGLLIRGDTPDGRYRVSITGRRRNFPVIVGADGASANINFYQLLHSINETKGREPGTPINTTHLGAIIEALHPRPNHRLGTDDMAALTKTIAKLSADHVQEKEASSNGYVWPNRDLREYIYQHDPLERTMSREPSVSEYQTLDEKGTRCMTTALTPKNAVFCDYDSVQTSLLNYAVREHAPRDVIRVHTDDPDVPTIRLLKADVENLDGTVNEYPAHLWNMERRSGRYDNHAVPDGERLPHSRVERVKKISLTMEIRRRGDSQPDVFTFDTDVYADQDRRRHLLLVTEDATVTRETLDDIAWLHSPRYDDPDVPEQLKQAMDQSPDEWYIESLLDTVHHGPKEAARRLLQKIADNADAMDMANPRTGTSQTMEAKSQNGTISITLNPSREQGFRLPEPPVGFVKVDPATLTGARALIVPTTENPGAIQPGHALRYSSYDGKLETFQPDGAHFTKRVHPLTVRPEESEALNIVRDQPDTTWVVVGRGSEYLVVAPAQASTQ